MKKALERGIMAIARRIWPRRLVEFRIDDAGPGDGADPPAGTRQPRESGPLSGRSAGVALDEPFDAVLTEAIGGHRRR